MSDDSLKYELWREAAGLDEPGDPVYIDTFDTMEDAKDAMARRAEAADLLHTDYEVRVTTDEKDQ